MSEISMDIQHVHGIINCSRKSKPNIYQIIHADNVIWKYLAAPECNYTYTNMKIFICN